MSITDENLIDAATEAREMAYCRYSGFAVGAAILDDNGQLHTGCNIENASYPLGNCAESSAISAMVLNGGHRIVRIAVVGGPGNIVSCSPCGGCRQRIFEFSDADTIVIAMDEHGAWKDYSVADLLPAGFRLD